MKKVLLLILVAVAMIAAPMLASAATQEWSDDIPLVTSGDVFSIPLFNPALGTLTSVYFELEGNFDGLSRYENEDETGTAVELYHSILLKMNRPAIAGGGTILSVNPEYMHSDTADSYDGVSDWGGTSGNTFNTPYTTLMDNTTTTDSGDLVFMTGIGFMELPVQEFGASYYFAPTSNNFSTNFQTTADANVKVVYTYTAVPEPISTTLFLVGAATLGFRRFRKV